MTHEHTDSAQADRAAANLREAAESLARARENLNLALDRYYAAHGEWRRAGRVRDSAYLNLGKERAGA